MARDGNFLNLAELSQHSSRQDCWLLINGKVYDVTKFLSDHPGGDDVLLSVTGKDATGAFEEVGHSSSGKAMLDDFYVGDIDWTEAKDTVIITNSNLTKQNQDNKHSELLFVKFFRFLVPILVLGLGLYVVFYTRTSSQ